LLGLDRDLHILEMARVRLASFPSRINLRQANFTDIETEMDAAGFFEADAILADLGMSSFALNDPSRGFSFRGDGPLDMRMDPELPVSAYDIVNHEEEVELARIIFTYGEERHSPRIARRIVE